MRRALYHALIAWKNHKLRKPLILRGARQVGKTFLLKLFGKSEFQNMLYVNFEESPAAKKLFEIDLNPKRILRDLSIQYNTEISPNTTLIFLDEIQECPNALTSLKYFQENANEYFVVAAGSLLGIKLSQAQGFPVGKVNFLTLYPCHFFEFLDATGKSKFREYLEAITLEETLSEPLHETLIESLKMYYFVGGMPEAVRHFAENEDLHQVRKIHKDILDAYLLDFSKHAPPNEVMKITAIWESIPAQLSKENKKFTFSGIAKSARSREYENAIQWLSDAGLIHRSFCLDTPRLPIDSYSNKSLFKVFLLDVGLLSTLSELPAKTILEGSALFTEFKGALTENFVAQELKASGHHLHYWASKGQAEVDFIVSDEGIIYPLEVKSGISTKQKSLLEYYRRYHPPFISRASLMNLQKKDHFCNYPLYLISRFPIKDT